MKSEDLDYIERQIKIALENCACLGRDAYGEYIESMALSLTNMIKDKSKK